MDFNSTEVNRPALLRAHEVYAELRERVRSSDREKWPHSAPTDGIGFREDGKINPHALRVSLFNSDQQAFNQTLNLALRDIINGVLLGRDRRPVAPYSRRVINAFLSDNSGSYSFALLTAFKETLHEFANLRPNLLPALHAMFLVRASAVQLIFDDNCMYHLDAYADQRDGVESSVNVEWSLGSIPGDSFDVGIGALGPGGEELFRRCPFPESAISYNRQSKIAAHALIYDHGVTSFVRSDQDKVFEGNTIAKEGRSLATNLTIGLLSQYGVPIDDYS